MDEKTKKIIRSMTMVTQIGLSMMVPIFLCGSIGVWMNRLFHTKLAFVFLLILGICSAFRNVYILTKPFYSKDMAEEHEKLQYMEDLKNYRREHPEEYETGEENIKRDDAGGGNMDVAHSSDSISG